MACVPLTRGSVAKSCATREARARHCKYQRPHRSQKHMSAVPWSPESKLETLDKTRCNEEAARLHLRLAATRFWCGRTVCRAFRAPMGERRMGRYARRID